MKWRPIETAPKDRDILVWYDHDADPYHDPDNPDRLTDYAANAEGADFLDDKGVVMARWQPPQFEAEDEYGNGFWLPGAWFSHIGYTYEAVCNATHWMPIPEPPEKDTQ